MKLNNKVEDALFKLKGKLNREYYFDKTFCILIMLACFIIVSFFNTEYNGSRAEKLILSAVVVSVIILAAIYFFYKTEFYKFAFIFIIVVGCLSVFIQPIFNIPDEEAHFVRAEMASRGEFFVNPDEQHFETIQSAIDIKDNLFDTYLESNLQGEKIDYEPVYTEWVAASNVAILYLPQAFGILIAKVLDLDVIWMLWLARLFNLIVYSGIISCIIKYSPRCKFILFFLAVLPMSIQQAGSSSPDALINAFAFAFLGYFIKLYYEESEVTWKNSVLLLVLGTAVTLSKVTNIFIVGLVLLIPNKRFKNKRNAICWKSILILAVVVIAILYYIYTTTFAPNLLQGQYLQEHGVDSTKQIEYIANNTIYWVKSFGYDLLNSFSGQIGMLNSFGALEYGYSIFTVIEIFLFGIICCRENGIHLGYFKKFLVFLMILGIYSTTFFALYLSWTPVGAIRTEGVQGRYFIPMFGLVYLLFSAEHRTDEKNNSPTYIKEMAVISGMLGVMLLITTFHYY